jgi:hypothetical protein
VPIFIDRGAPLRNRPSAPNAADFALEAATRIHTRVRVVTDLFLRYLSSRSAHSADRVPHKLGEFPMTKRELSALSS